MEVRVTSSEGRMARDGHESGDVFAATHEQHILVLLGALDEIAEAPVRVGDTDVHGLFLLSHLPTQQCAGRNILHGWWD
jgi:hypothetical protein